MIITITPAERDLARLAVDLDERMGKEPDPRMVVLANATSELPRTVYRSPCLGRRPGRPGSFEIRSRLIL